MLPLWIVSTVFFFGTVSGLVCKQYTEKYTADLGQFPYVVSVQQSAKGLQPFEHVSGGAIIAPMWVLTAHIHLVYNKGPLRIQAGFVDFEVPGINIQTISVKEIIKHPKYYSSWQPHDMSLLKLTRPLEFNNYVAPVALPFQIQTPTGSARLAYWSHTYYNGIANRYLQFMDLDFITRTDCKWFLDDLPSFSPVDELYNCCTKPDPTINSCGKDVGSPLVQDGRLIGTITWSAYLCRDKCAPFVYSRVDSDLNFIRSVTGLEIG